MKKVDRPPNLIAYDTDANVVARMSGDRARYRLLRPRTILYAVLFAGVALLMLWSLLGRQTLDINVLRDRQPNFVQLSDGSVRNGYTLKVMNKATEPRKLFLKVTGLDAPRVNVAGQSGLVLQVPADETVDFRVTVTADTGVGGTSRQDIDFTVSDPDSGDATTQENMFVSGNGRT